MNKEALPVGLTQTIALFRDISRYFEPKRKNIDAYIVATRNLNGFDYRVRLCVICSYDPQIGLLKNIVAQEYGASVEDVRAKDGEEVAFSNGQLVRLSEEEREEAAATFGQGFDQAFGGEE